jgi:SAM-dependent methyltransferase
MQSSLLLPPSLQRDKIGLWRCNSQGGKISYPEGGLASYSEVEDRSFWCSHRNECIIAVMRRFPPSGPVVDLGGGTGYVASGLQHAGFQSIVVEADPGGAFAAHERGVEHVICGPFQDVDFALGSLPAAGLFDVLEHIADDLGALRHIHGLLVPDGRLYVTVPAYNLLFSGEDRMLGHFRRYNAGSLKRVLVNAGFTVEYTSYLFMPFPLPIFVARTLPGWLGGFRHQTPEASARAHNVGGLFRRILDRYLLWEARVIVRGDRLSIGSSCLAVARKI